MFRWMSISLILLISVINNANATEILHIYGPGGPAPAMRAAAKEFSQIQHVDIKVMAGPTDQWAKQFAIDGDIIYSGSEAMMSDFTGKFPESLNTSTVEPLYLRPAAILVRKGNPKHINGFHDLLKPDARVMVVQGAGQVGLWEDIAGRDGDINTIRTFRKNIRIYASNSKDALQHWQEDPQIDAWLIYTIWAVANPGVADVVSLEPHYRIYRDTDVALTHRGQTNPLAGAFIEFLKSAAGKKIFEQYGWVDKEVINQNK